MKSKVVSLICGVTLTGWHVCAQTQIDLRTQSKAVDLSAANSTKPSKAGAVLPATCSVGETFFRTDAVAGRNLYGCTSANTWVQQGDGTGDTSGGAYAADMAPGVIWTVAGAEHGFDTADLAVFARVDTGTSYRWIEPDQIEIDKTTHDVSVSWGTSQAGRILILKNGGSGAGNGAAVWGGISGTLSNQADLNAALSTKAPAGRAVATGSGLTGGGDLSADRTIALSLDSDSGLSTAGGLSLIRTCADNQLLKWTGAGGAARMTAPKQKAAMNSK